MKRYRVRPVIPILIVILGLLLQQCATFHGRTVDSFHDSDRYTYIKKDMNGDSKVDYVQRLDRETGWKDVFYLDLNHDGVFEEKVDFNKIDTGNLVHIIFATDGVPFRVMKELRHEGYFRLFRSVGGMIAPFPSLTGVSWPKILHREAPPGYEAYYYDRRDNKIEKSTGEMRFPAAYNHISNFQHARAYVEVKSYAEDEINSRYRVAVQHLGSKKTILLYFLCSDATGHRSNDEEYREILISVNDLIERIFYAYHCRCRLTIVSDHGNNRKEGTWVDIVGPLKDAGFHYAKSLKSKNDFVIPLYGMIGTAAIYTDPENVPAMAAVLAAREGVDFCVYPASGGLVVRSSKGEAVVRWRKHKAWYELFGLFSRERDFLYNPLRGDPLDLLPIIIRTSGLEVDRFAPEKRWLEATQDSEYPDPLRRLAHAFIDNVDNPANLIVALQDQYFSSGVVHYLAKSAGTHGNLGAHSSIGIVGTNWRDVPPYTRAEDVKRKFLGGVYRADDEPVEPGRH